MGRVIKGMLDLKRYLGNEKGFTMIEMMVVLIIIAVLMGTGIKFYTSYIDKARVTKAKAEISIMQAAVDSYYAEHHSYPATSDTDISAAGLSTAVIGGDETRQYTYVATEAIENNKYKGYIIYTSEPVGDNTYVVATGTKGRSNPPITTSTTNVYH